MSKKPFNYLLDNDFQSQNHSTPLDGNKEETKEINGGNVSEIEKKMRIFKQEKEKLKKQIDEMNEQVYDIDKIIANLKDEKERTQIANQINDELNDSKHNLPSSAEGIEKNDDARYKFEPSLESEGNHAVMDNLPNVESSKSLNESNSEALFTEQNHPEHFFNNN